MSFSPLRDSNIRRENQIETDNASSRNTHTEVTPHTWIGRKLMWIPTAIPTNVHFLNALPQAHSVQALSELKAPLTQITQCQDKENSPEALSNEKSPSLTKKLKISGIKRVATKLHLDFPPPASNKKTSKNLSEASISSVQADELSDLQTESSIEVNKDEVSAPQRKQLAAQNPHPSAARLEALLSGEVSPNPSRPSSPSSQFSETTREQLIDALISEYERRGTLEFETLHEISLEISDYEQEIEFSVPPNSDVFLEFESPPGSDSESNSRLAEELGFEVIGDDSDGDYEFVATDR